MADLVKQMKLAIQQAHGSLDEGGIRISKVDIEIKTALELSGEAGLTLKIVPVDLSGKYERSEVQTITLSMVPEPPSVDLMAPVSDELKGAIEVVSKAVQEASASKPAFGLTEATVGLNIGVTKDGSIKVLVGGKARETSTHSIKLTLCRK